MVAPKGVISWRGTLFIRANSLVLIINLKSMQEYICSTCGYTGKPKVKDRGSCVLLFFLFLFFVIPGVFYMIWMMAGKRYFCPQCKKDTMIPLGTPMGQKLFNDLYNKKKS